MLNILAEPNCKDIAWGWILTLFGTDGSSCAGAIVNAQNVNSPFASAFAVLTAALAFIGSMFLSYHVVAGIVQSAYSGKVLGERWHQIWAPLRVVFGFGLMIPVGGGFSSIHYVLRDFVAPSAINMANAVIGTYITASTTQAAGNSAKIIAIVGSDYANKFMQKLICAGVITADGSHKFITGYTATAPTAGAPVTLTEKVMSLGSATGYQWDFGDCGKLVLKDLTVDKIDSSFFSSGSTGGVFSSGEAAQALTNFNAQRYQATEKLYQSMKLVANYDKIGEEISQHYDSVKGATAAMIKQMRTDEVAPYGVQDKINTAAATWNEKVSTLITDMFKSMATDSQSGAKALLPDYGFMVAGAYERTLSALSGISSGIANQNMTSTSSSFDENTTQKLAMAGTIFQTSNFTDNKGNGTGSAGSDGTDPQTEILSSVFPNIKAVQIESASSDPVGDMIMFGNNLLAIASYAIIAIGGLKVAASGIQSSLWDKLSTVVTVYDFGAAGKELVDYVSGWLTWALMIMILIGLLHSFVLPMMPMIMIFTMGTSWLVMFLEASIAGVLWAFVFIRMDGHELFDSKQSPGVGLLFNLFLRPALGMLAFVGGLVLLPALLNALSVVWLNAFYLQTGLDHIGMNQLWQWLASIIMYAWMQWNITIRITSLIPTITDRVGAWMGINASGYNDGGETGQHVGAMVAAGQAIGRAPIMQQSRQRISSGGGGGGGGGSPQPNKAQLAETAAEVGAGAATAGPVGAATALASKASKK